MIECHDSRTFGLCWRESWFPTAFSGRNNVLSHIFLCRVAWLSGSPDSILIGSPLLSLSLSFCLSVYLFLCLFFISLRFSIFPLLFLLSIVKASPKLREKQKTHSVWPHKNCRASIRPAFFGATTSLGDDFLEVELPLHLDDNCGKKSNRSKFIWTYVSANSRSTDCKDFSTTSHGI